MKFKKLVSALTLGTVMSTIALGTVSCLDGNVAEEADKEFWEGYDIQQLESQKDKIQLEANEVNLLPGATCEIPIIPEEGNITYDYASNDRDIAVVVEKDGRAVVVAKEKEGKVTITIRSSNNKIAYFTVNVSNVIQTIDEEEIGSESYLSDTSLSNSLPEKILINDNEDAKKITVVEGSTLTLSATLSPVIANGKWQIYWHYDFQDGDDPNYIPSPADYFAYKLVDSATGGEVNDSGQIDTAEGLWANGIKMGYKVEVVGLKAGKGRKLICESVGGIKRTFDVEVIGKKTEEAVANITVIGNKGSEVEIEGLGTSYVTAVSYGAGVTTSDTFKAESLTPEICTVDTTSSSFVSGGFASISAVSVGTGWVKVSSGSACAVAKVTISDVEIQAIGNLRFDVTSKVGNGDNKGKRPKSGDDEGSEYSNSRYIADGEDTQIIGNFFPTIATKYPNKKDVAFITDYKRVGDSADDITEVSSDYVYFYQDGTLISKSFKADFKTYKQYAESCLDSMGDNTMIIALKEKITSTDKKGIRNARKSIDEGGFGAEFGFVVTNDDVTQGSLTSSSAAQVGSSSSATATKVPVFFVMNTGANDIKATSNVSSKEKSEYTEIMEDLSLKKRSILYTSNESVLPSTIDVDKSYTLPTIVDKVPYKAPFERGEGSSKVVVETSYTFKNWVTYTVSSKSVGTTAVTSVKPTSSDKVIIVVANYQAKETEKSAFE